MAKLDVVHGWDQVRDYLPKNYSALADEHGQVETKFGNAKIRDADTLLRYLLLHVGANLPLRQTVALMAEAGMPNLSPMRLHKKMCRAAPYLRALVTEMVDWSRAGASDQWGGYVFSAVDSTIICGPGATGIDARIHTKLRVSDVALTSVEVTDKRGGETLCRFDWAPGELAVADRGYCSVRGVSHVVNSGADVLVRYKLVGLPMVDANGDEVDVLSHARTLAREQTLDLDVCVPTEGRQIKGRLIIMRLPLDAEKRALKRAHAEKCAGNSARALEITGYVVLFTTATRSRLSAQRCLQAYRLRWQIELQFKRWKSLCSFDALPNMRDDTILAWLYGKVLLGVLLDRMAFTPTELSPPEDQGRLVVDLSSDVVRPVEANQHPLPTRHRRASSPRAA